MTLEEEHELFRTISDINQLCENYGYSIEETMYSFCITSRGVEIFRAARLKEILGFLYGIEYHIRNVIYDLHNP